MSNKVNDLTPEDTRCPHCGRDNEGHLDEPCSDECPQYWEAVGVPYPQYAMARADWNTRHDDKAWAELEAENERLRAEVARLSDPTWFYNALG